MTRQANHVTRPCARNWAIDRGSGAHQSLQRSPVLSPRVAHRLSLVGLRWRHISARPVGPSMSASTTSVAQMVNTQTNLSGPVQDWPITYEELPREHQAKYDQIKARFEADLIGSFERTHNHGIRWKGFSPEGTLDEVDLSVPSEERPRALHQEVNYMLAHSHHRHYESDECIRTHGHSLRPRDHQTSVLSNRPSSGKSQRGIPFLD